MTPANDSSRTVIMRTWFCTWERPEMMRPVWPPEMPKTYSMPASARTRATNTRAGISSVSMRSIAIASSSRQPNFRSVGGSLPRERHELNEARGRSQPPRGADPKFPANREFCAFKSPMHRETRGNAAFGVGRPEAAGNFAGSGGHSREFAARAGSRQGRARAFARKTEKIRTKPLRSFDSASRMQRKLPRCSQKAATAELREGIQHCHSGMGTGRYCSLFVPIQEPPPKKHRLREIAD